MRGEVHTPGGEIIPLPEFTAWRLIHTDGRSADSFEVRFPTREDLLVRLLRGVNFYAVDGGATVFCGVVDEAEAIWADEYTTTLCGRGLAARLMDNQAGGAQFFNLDMNSVLDRYVRPFGIGQIRVEGGPWRTQMVSVPAGCSCKQVLDGFCRLVGAPQPRFDPDGTLRIARGLPGICGPVRAPGHGGERHPAGHLRHHHRDRRHGLPRHLLRAHRG